MVLGAIAGCALLLLGFLVLASEVTRLHTDDFDRAVLLALRRAPDDPLGSRAVEEVMLNLSALGSAAVTMLIAGLVTAYYALAGHRWYAALIVVSTGGAALVMTALKQLYARPRPSIVTQLGVPSGLSFPSGHSMLAAALYVTLAVMIARTLERRRLRVFVVAAGVAIALLVGVTRVYLGMHYPTDVLAGWTAGLLWALACGLVVRQLGRRGVRDLPVPAVE